PPAAARRPRAHALAEGVERPRLRPGGGPGGVEHPQKDSPAVFAKRAGQQRRQGARRVVRDRKASRQGSHTDSESNCTPMRHGPGKPMKSQVAESEGPEVRPPRVGTMVS